VKKQRRTSEPAAPAATAKPGANWHWKAALAVLAVVTFEAYSGAFHGAFLLDDLYLAFMNPDADHLSWRIWLGTRPLLMATFWLNYQLSGTEPYSYHVVNVVLHILTGVVIFFLMRWFLEQAGEQEQRRDLFSTFAAGIFLLHPVQTEAVAYVASRSDVLCTLLACLSLLVMVRSSQPIRWGRAALVLALFAGAGTAKQQAVALPVVFLLVDLYRSRDGGWQALKQNWRLHGPVVAGAVLGGGGMLYLLRHEATAGLTARGVQWYEYFFTQCRVFWQYVRLLLVPIGLNVDPDVPYSRSLAEHGAWAGLAALLALIVFAWVMRRRFPVAALGVFLSLTMLAPTSSILVIIDPLAERRLYFPMIGFLLVLVDVARRWPPLTGKPAAAVMAVALAGMGFLTYPRAAVWGDALALWRDTAAKSPEKYRPRFQLGFALFQAGRCAEAIPEFAKAAQLREPNDMLLVDWALALDCAGRPEEAIQRLRQAAELEDTAHIRSLMGMVHGKQGRNEEGMRELERAIKLNPRYGMAYLYRGNIHAAMGDWGKAREDYRLALDCDPGNPAAAQALAMAEQQLGAR